MKSLLWFLFAVLVSLPLGTYFVYYRRRLGTRRKQLLQTLQSLSLEDEYMRMRYKDKYDKWSKCPDPVDEFERKYFGQDFWAGNSHSDYAWPVLLFTVFSVVGWLLTLDWVFASFVPLPGMTRIPDGLAYGFIGAYLACVLTIFDGFRRYDLDPGLYYSVTFRLMFSSFAAYVLSLAFAPVVAPVVALGVSLLPVERMWTFLADRASAMLGVGQAEKEPGDGLEKIQGLEHPQCRQRLKDAGISTVQGLATADPLLLFFRTTFPLRTIIDMIDKAILYLYLGDKVVELRRHGVNGVIELVALTELANGKPAYGSRQDAAADESMDDFFADIKTDDLIADLAQVIGQTRAELKTFIYNMYYDPVVRFIYEIWGRHLKSTDNNDSDKNDSGEKNLRENTVARVLQ